MMVGIEGSVSLMSVEVRWLRDASKKEWSSGRCCN